MSALDGKDGPSPEVSEAKAKIGEKVASHGNELAVDDSSSLDRAVENELNTTDKDLHEAKLIAEQMSLDEVRALMKDVLKMHEHDPNFPSQILARAKEFLDNEDVVQRPDDHADLIYEMKIEAALITNNSPYSEVRAVVDNHDDPNMPSSTIRVWFIGLFFSALLAFINQMFSIRYPPISLESNFAQLLAYPVGKFCEAVLPDWGFTLWGIRHSLNPGPFNKKEHMLITLMGNVAASRPYTTSIIWVQFLPQYFNQSYAASFAYQILLAISTNYIGYGMAGLTRRFLVFPSYCVWPASLVTVALNTAFHSSDNPPVQGPFRTTFTLSRYRFFLIVCGLAFVWFWFTDYIFQRLSRFSWMTWIAPDNVALTAITGFSGLGFNPLPTFDWNIFAENWDPLQYPFFSIFNVFLGCFFSGLAIAGVWWSNRYWTSYIPIISNRTWDNKGKLYEVARAVNERGWFDGAKYEAYSPAFMSAGSLATYFAFFAQYPAALVYISLNHGYEVKMGFKNLYNSIRRRGDTQQGQYKDVHNRLMATYPEVPEWWYLIVLVLSIAAGVGGIAGWETYTSPLVVIYGLVLCIIFVIPLGLVKSMTGIEVTLNVLAEFIGGTWVEGNALAMNFFKSYGYVTCSHTLLFATDLKLGHYVKIPPRHTFWAQMVATMLSTVICTALLNYQMGIENVCTKDAPFKMTCPGVNTFFTASVFWGTIGPKKLFGVNGQYVWVMAGWAVGAIVPVIQWGVMKRFPATRRLLRQFHPVVIWSGAMFYAPYNMSFLWPSVPIGWFSWVWLKKRYLALWSKYNFVLSTALVSGIAVSSTVIFFALSFHGIELDWWGNDMQGCEGKGGCALKSLAPGETFGPTEWH